MLSTTLLLTTFALCSQGTVFNPVPSEFPPPAAAAVDALPNTVLEGSTGVSLSGTEVAGYQRFHLESGDSIVLGWKDTLLFGVRIPASDVTALTSLGTTTVTEGDGEEPVLTVLQNPAGTGNLYAITSNSIVWVQANPTSLLVIEASVLGPSVPGSITSAWWVGAKDATLMVKVLDSQTGTTSLYSWVPALGTNVSWHHVLTSSAVLPSSGSDSDSGDDGFSANIWCDRGMLSFAVRACFTAVTDSNTGGVSIDVLDAQRGQVVASLPVPPFAATQPGDVVGASTWCDAVPVWTNNAAGLIQYPTGDPASATITWLYDGTSASQEEAVSSITTVQPLCELDDGTSPALGKTIGIAVNLAQCSYSPVSLIISPTHPNLIFSTVSFNIGIYGSFGYATYGATGTVAMYTMPCGNRVQGAPFMIPVSVNGSGFINVTAAPVDRRSYTETASSTLAFETVTATCGGALRTFVGTGIVIQSTFYLFDLSGALCGEGQTSSRGGSVLPATVQAAQRGYFVEVQGSQWTATEQHAPAPLRVLLPAYPFWAWRTEAQVPSELVMTSSWFHPPYNITTARAGTSFVSLGEIATGFHFNLSSVPRPAFFPETNRLIVVGASYLIRPNRNNQYRTFVGVIDVDTPRILAQDTSEWTNTNYYASPPYIYTSPDGLYVLTVQSNSQLTVVRSFSGVNGTMLRSERIQSVLFTSCGTGFVQDYHRGKVVFGCSSMFGVIDLATLRQTHLPLPDGMFGSGTFTQNGTQVTSCFAGRGPRSSGYRTVNAAGDVTAEVQIPTRCDSMIQRSERGYLYTVAGSVVATGSNLIRLRESDLGDGAAVPIESFISFATATLKVLEQQQLLLLLTGDVSYGITPTITVIDLIRGKLLWQRSGASLLAIAPSIDAPGPGVKNTLWVVDVVSEAVGALNVFDGHLTFQTAPHVATRLQSTYGQVSVFSGWANNTPVVQGCGASGSYSNGMVPCLWYSDNSYFTHATPPEGFRSSSEANFPSSRFPLSQLPTLPPPPPPPDRHTNLIVGCLVAVILLCATAYLVLTNVGKYLAQRQVVRAEAKLLAEVHESLGQASPPPTPTTSLYDPPAVATAREP